MDRLRLNDVQQYIVGLYSLHKLIRNWHVVALHAVTRDMYLPRKSRYRSPLILNTIKPEARITIKDNFDLGTLMDIFRKKSYFYKDVNIEKDDKLILDVGAHIGLFAIFCALVHKHVKVYSYEPFHENYLLLLRNLKLNKLLDTVHHRNYAISGKEGTIKLYLSDSNLSHSTTIDKWNVERNRSRLVRAVSLESVFHNEGLRRVDFMKMNCEGCEYDVLDRINACYLENISKLAIQCHNLDSKRNYRTIKRLLKRLGFKVCTRHYDYKHTLLYAKSSR